MAPNPVPQTDQDPNSHSEFNISSDILRPDSSKLSGVLDQYAQALSEVKEADLDITPAQALKVLVSRDAVHATVSQQNPLSPEQVIQLSRLDTELKQRATVIASVGKLAQWRESLHPPTDAWWWFFETPQHVTFLERLNPVMDGFTVLLLTAVISFMTALTPRFAVGGLDFLKSFGLIGNGAVAVLVFSSLTQAGRPGFEKLLEQFNVSSRYRSVVSFSLAAALLGLAVYVQTSLPKLALYYYNQGSEHFANYQFAQAEKDLKQSIELNPEDPKAHSLLGRTYEFLENFDAAKAEYRIAVQGWDVPALTNLARLYIGDGKQLEAETLLQRGLASVDKNDFDTNYALRKNLGWDLLQQKRYEEAQQQLTEAIALNNKAPADVQRWDANCILAQVLDAQKNRGDALKEAKICTTKAAFYTTFDYRFGIWAKRRVEEANKVKKDNKALLASKSVPKVQSKPSPKRTVASAPQYRSNRNSSSWSRSAPQYNRRFPESNFAPPPRYVPIPQGREPVYPQPPNARTEAPPRSYY